METFPIHQLLELKKLFQMVGFRSPSMDDVSSHLKISKKTLYKYVANKNELVELIIRLHINEFDIRLYETQQTITKQEELLTELTNWLELIYTAINKKSYLDLERYYPNAFQIFKTYETEVCLATLHAFFKDHLPNYSEKKTLFSATNYLEKIQTIAHNKTTIQIPLEKVLSNKAMKDVLITEQQKILGLN